MVPPHADVLVLGDGLPAAEDRRHSQVLAIDLLRRPRDVARNLPGGNVCSETHDEETKERGNEARLIFNA